MKQIAQNEIFKNLSGFLKSRGIELTDGSYSHGIKQSCSLLTNAINVGQESLEKAKAELDRTCDYMRQVIHEKTAPKAPPVMTRPSSNSAGAKASSGNGRKAKPSVPAKKKAPKRKS